MIGPSEMLATYLYLAKASQRRSQPMVRDRMLVLAAALAVEMDLNPIAAHCRSMVLLHNEKHMLGKFPTVYDAMTDETFRGVLKQLRRRYPPEKAERLLVGLGFSIEGERDAYFSDFEYAASLLDSTPDELTELYGPQ